MGVVYKWVSQKTLKLFCCAFGAVHFPLFSDQGVAYKWGLLINGGESWHRFEWFNLCIVLVLLILFQIEPGFPPCHLSPIKRKPGRGPLGDHVGGSLAKCFGCIDPRSRPSSLLPAGPCPLWCPTSGYTHIFVYSFSTAFFILRVNMNINIRNISKIISIQ